MCHYYKTSRVGDGTGDQFLKGRLISSSKSYGDNDNVDIICVSVTTLLWSQPQAYAVSNFRWRGTHIDNDLLLQ